MAQNREILFSDVLQGIFMHQHSDSDCWIFRFIFEEQIERQQLVNSAKVALAQQIDMATQSMLQLPENSEERKKKLEKIKLKEQELEALSKHG